MRLIFDKQLVIPENPTNAQVEVYADSSGKLSTVDSTGLERQPIINSEVANFNHFKHIGGLGNQYHTCGILGISASQNCPNNTIICASPFTSIRGGVINALGVRMGPPALSGSKLYLGIYNTISSTDLRPHNLLWNGSVLGTVGNAVNTTNPNFSPDPTKMYWIAGTWNPDSANAYPQWFCVNSTSSSIFIPLGGTFGATVGNNGFIISTKVSGVYNGLPDPWPVGDTQTYSVTSVNQMPAFIYRYSS